MCDCLIHQEKCAIVKFNLVWVFFLTWCHSTKWSTFESWILHYMQSSLGHSSPPTITHSWLGGKNKREREHFQSQPRPPLGKWPPEEHDLPLRVRGTGSYSAERWLSLRSYGAGAWTSLLPFPCPSAPAALALLALFFFLIPVCLRDSMAEVNFHGLPLSTPY